MRYDIVSPRPRKNSDKPYWHRVGTAFEGDKGLTLVFDSLPLPDNEGRVAVKLFEQRERQEQQRGNGGPANRYTSDDDHVPFIRGDGIW